MSFKLLRAAQTLNYHRDGLTEVLREEFPVGAVVSWVKNGPNIQKGVVDSHGYGDRIKVVNQKTKKCIWICSCHIIEAYAAVRRERSNG